MPGKEEFYNMVMESVKEKLGGDILLLPSSVHEVIAIPSGMYGAELETVTRVNTEVLDKEQYLSDSVYAYSRKTGRVEIAGRQG